MSRFAIRYPLMMNVRSPVGRGGRIIMVLVHGVPSPNRRLQRHRSSPKQVEFRGDSSTPDMGLQQFKQYPSSNNRIVGRRLTDRVLYPDETMFRYAIRGCANYQFECSDSDVT